MYDTPTEDHSNLSHDLPPGTGNTPDERLVIRQAHFLRSAGSLSSRLSTARMALTR